MGYTVRAYTPADQTSWLRCRVLSFLGTAYFDDVQPSKRASALPALDLVVVDGAGSVVGIMDTSVEGELATIATVAIHPDHRRRGLGRGLLGLTRDQARRAGASTLDAWTRDDEETLRWYRATGFVESDHYLHVYASYYTDRRGTRPRHHRTSPRPAPDGLPSSHAALADAARLRSEFGSRPRVPPVLPAPVNPTGGRGADARP